MFDIGWQELFVIGAITIIVVGPKDLPRVLKQVTLYVRKARSIARDFQSSIDDVVREAELDDIRKQVEAGGLNDISGQIEKSLDLDIDEDDYGDQFREVKAEIEDATKAIEAPDPAPPAAEPKPEPAAEPTPAPDSEPKPAGDKAKSSDSASG